MMGAFHIDSFFVAKSPLAPCEDYALAGDRPLPHLILADGCSNSPGTHLGAALMVHAARNALFQQASAGRGRAADLPGVDRLGRSALREASRMARWLRLPATALDVTLMVMVAADRQFDVTVYGDGCIAWRPLGASVERVVEIRYDTNAPYYLSYQLDADRRQRYHATLGGPKRICGPGLAELVVAHDAPTRFIFPMAGTEMLALASDGLGAFVGAGTNDRLALEEAAAIFTAFKSPCGAFVQRRVRRGLRQLERRGYHLSDDLSLAALWRVGTSQEAA
jgi:hypothetical protein